MKLLMCLVLGLAMLLDICQAQFGFGPVQNCAGSNCNQNNFGRKRRQILEEILAKVEADEDAKVEVDEDAKVVKRQAQNCQGSACNQNNFGAGGAGAGVGGAGGQVQNCVGSECNQNNLGPIAPAQVPVPAQGPVIVEPPPAPVAVVGQPLPGGQVQNCQGSSCNQNNLGPIAPGPVVPAPGPFPFPGGFPFVGGSPFTPGFPFAGGAGLAGAGLGGAGGQVQNCVGSECNQNNLGKRKREIAEAINALTTEVLEAEDEAVAEDAVESVSKSKRDADAQSQNCFGSSCNQNNFGRRKREVIAALLQELL